MHSLLTTTNKTDCQVNKDSVTADAVEIHFKDQYLGRCDMWRLEEGLEEQCIHHEEKITFAGCIAASIKAIYVRGKKVRGDSEVD